MDICLKCGSEPPLISQICHKCVRETVVISRLPDVLRMVDCKLCYSLKIPGTWLEFDDLESAVSHFFESSIIWKENLSQQKSTLLLEQLDPAKFRVKAKTNANYGGLSLESNLEGVVEIKYQVCQTCSRRAGGYYEAILQIRTKQKSVLNAAVEKVFKDIDSSPSEFFSTENGPAKGGFDFQLSSTERARSLARELMIQFGGHVNETNTLVGRKDGRDLLRHTFGVRLPSFLVGDYLLIQEKVYRVNRLDRRKAKLRLMEAPYTKKMVEIDTLRTPNILEKPVEVQIISSREDQFLLLDPYTHQTVEAVSPSNWEGETIQALRFGNETFFLWN